MNGLSSRSRDAATPEERGHDGRYDPSTGREHSDRAAGDRAADGHGAASDRPRGHDPIADEIDVDGAPMAVDRCRFCGVVLVNPRRPGGPCPGLNHTLDEFGITPPTERDGASDRTIGKARPDRSPPADRRGTDTGERTSVLASR